MESEEQEVRQRLIDTALRLFAEHGRDHVSLRQIAAEAGVTHGSIRYHFGTKDKLFLTAVMQMAPNSTLDDLVAPLSLSSREEAEEALRQIVQRFVLFQARVGEDRSAALGLMQAEVTRDGGPDRVFFRTVMKPGHARLKAVIARIRPDITDDKTLEILAFNVIFQCVMVRIGRGTIMKLLGTRRLAKADISLISDLIVSVTLNGLRGLKPE